jgi:hypothetical protein
MNPSVFSPLFSKEGGAGASAPFLLEGKKEFPPKFQKRVPAKSSKGVPAKSYSKKKPTSPCWSDPKYHMVSPSAAVLSVLAASDPLLYFGEKDGRKMI